MDIFEQLRRDEKVEAKPYRDNSTRIGFEGKPGKLTIGVGRNLDDVGLSDAEINYLLGNDVAKATGGVRMKLPWVDELDDARMGVLVNMTFNMGVDGLLKFVGMLGKLQRKLYDESAAEMVDSAWYHQTGDRAKRLVKQMQTGEWQ